MRFTVIFNRYPEDDPHAPLTERLEDPVLA
jgi:hypothetical protein